MILTIFKSTYNSRRIIEILGLVENQTIFLSV